MTFRNLFPFLLLALLTTGVCAQSQSPGDSLKLLSQIFDATIREDPETAIGTARQSLALSRRLDDKGQEGAALFNIGQGYYYLGQYAEALENYKSARELLYRNAGPQLNGRLYNAMGNTYTETQQYATALKNYQNALRWLPADTTIKVMVLANIGAVNIYLQAYDSAFQYYEDMLELSGRDPRQRLIYLSNTGFIFYQQEKYDRALASYRETVSMIRALRDNSNLPRAYKNLGDCYLRMGEYDSARLYMDRGLALSREMKLHAQEVDQLIAMSALQDSTGNIIEALRFAKEAHQAVSQTSDFSMSNLYSHLANVYKHSGDLQAALKYERLNGTYLDSIRLARQKVAVTMDDVMFSPSETTSSSPAWLPWTAVALLGGVAAWVFYRARRNRKSTPSKSAPLATGGYMKVQHSGGEVILQLADILWFEKDDRSYFALTKDNKYRVRQTIAELEAMLPLEFVRINRAVIVNISWMLNFSPWENNKYIVRMKIPAGKEFISTRDRIRKIEEVVVRPGAS